MKQYHRWATMLAGFSLALGLAAMPAQAGRIHSRGDTAFEFSRIISQYQGGTTETIAAGETTPSAPIAGETLIKGYSNRFPEFAEVWTWRSNEGWKKLDANSFTFNTEVVTPPGSSGALTSVVFRFSPGQVRLIQNAYVYFQLRPQPPGPFGDVVEALWLRGPGF